MASPDSAKYRLMELRLGRNLAQYVTGLRAQGHSWRDIAKHLTATTGEPIQMQTLRLWFPDDRGPDLEPLGDQPVDLPGVERVTVGGPA